VKGCSQSECDAGQALGNLVWSLCVIVRPDWGACRVDRWEFLSAAPDDLEVAEAVGIVVGEDGLIPDRGCRDGCYELASVAKAGELSAGRSAFRSTRRCRRAAANPESFAAAPRSGQA
jgi:hypothetical protein